MKTTLWIPIALALGVVLGVFLAGILSTATPNAPAPNPPAIARAPSLASEPVVPIEPVLRGRPAAAEASPGGAAQPSAPIPPRQIAEVIELLGPGGMQELVEWEGQSESLDQRGWNALLTLYAMAGRRADFERGLPSGMEAGITPDQVLELIQLMPYEEQVAAADHVREAFPDMTWAVATLATIYTGAGAGERAFEVLVPALEAGADSGLAALLVQASPDRAARVLGALCSGEGWTQEIIGEIGGAFVQASRPELALPFLQDALGREPMSHSVLTYLSQVDPTLALEHARRLTETHADQTEVWSWLGQMEMTAGNAEAAFDAYREAATRNLTTESLYGMMRADPERAYATALALTEETSDDEVLGAVAKVALKSGHDADTLATLLRAHQRDPTDHEWMVAMVALDPTRAAAVLGETAETFEGDSRDEVLGAHGNALSALGQHDDAFGRFREAFEIDPSDWEWQRGMARTDPARATPLLEARREESGAEGDLLGALADAYAGTGRREEAITLYGEAVAAGGGDEWYARMALVDPESATQLLEARTREEPETANVWAALGDLRENLGDRTGARAAYDQARRLNETSLLYEIRWRNLAD